jgi:hypothetical protein
MTDCDPDLVARPTVVDDPLSDAEAPGQILSWACCGVEYFLAPSSRKEPERTYAAWHVAARVLSKLSRSPQNTSEGS